MSISSLLTNNTKDYLRLKVKSIEADEMDIGSVEVDTIKVDIIEEKTLSNGVQIDKPRAFTLNDEYGDYSLAFSSIDNTAFKIPTGFVNINTGSQPYIPLSDTLTKTVTVQEDGFYLLHMECVNNEVLNAGDHIGARVERVGAGLLASNSEIVGTQTGAGTYIVSLNYNGYLQDGDELSFHMRVVAGPSTNKSFVSRVFITRLK